MRDIRSFIADGLRAWFCLNGDPSFLFHSYNIVTSLAPFSILVKPLNERLFYLLHSSDYFACVLGLIPCDFLDTQG